MKIKSPSVCLVLLLAAMGCTEMTRDTKLPDPPLASVRPQLLEMHGHSRQDDYSWLKDRDNPEVVAYLEAENAYTEAVMKPHEALGETLFEEIVGRIAKDDSTVPYREDGSYYYQRWIDGSEYPLYCRRMSSLEADEEIILDGNDLARGHEFFSLRGVRPSPDGSTVAYAVDTVGRRKYELRFRNLDTGEDLPDVIREVTTNSVWTNDSQAVFYTKQHPQTLRWYRVYRHALGTDPAQDEMVYEEADEEFGCEISVSTSKRYLLVRSDQTRSTEYRYLDQSDPRSTFQLFHARELDHEYSIDHIGDTFFVRTNFEAANFRLMSTVEPGVEKERWREVIPHREDVFVTELALFDDYFVVAERTNGVTKMRVVAVDGSDDHYVDFRESNSYSAGLKDNKNPSSSKVRFWFSSLKTPMSTIDYDLRSRERSVLKEEPVLGGFDSADYETERLFATAKDGVEVPISLVYRKDLFAGDGSNPLLLYGYGSYGSTVAPSFNSHRLSLIDRGFVYAIAHVRGGQLLGRAWYEDGKLMKKKNSFTDFIDVAEHLVAERYTAPERLFAEGASAGGLLMGGVTNMAPQLFGGVVSQVPFVDVVTTMLDASIPLTTGEWDEWGDPAEKEAFEYMLSYSPYDNLEAKEYPHILVTAGLHDSQVQYWEPAKYVAKLRTLKTDNRLLLLRTNMEAGHGGSTGRYKRYRDRAFEYAFLLSLSNEPQS